MAGMGAFKRYTVPLFGIGFAALVFLIGLSFWLVQRTQTYTDELNTTRAARANTLGLLSSIQDAETGQRGFLLTQDPSYLEPNRRGERAVPGGSCGQFADFYVQDPETARVLAEFEATVHAKIAELNRTIGAGAEWSSRPGHCGRQVGRGQTSDGRHTRRRRQASDLRRHAQQCAVDGPARQCPGATLGDYCRRDRHPSRRRHARNDCRRDTNRLMEARDEIRSLNVNLENRVEERTLPYHAPMTRFSVLLISSATI